jgi:hypothetical protein
MPYKVFNKIKQGRCGSFLNYLKQIKLPIASFPIIIHTKSNERDESIQMHTSSCCITFLMQRIFNGEGECAQCDIMRVKMIKKGEFQKYSHMG